MFPKGIRYHLNSREAYWHHSHQSFIMLLRWSYSISKKVFFPQNPQRCLKNHWTNTKHICTHLKAFFMLNPKLALTVKILKICEKSFKKNYAVVCIKLAPRLERANVNGCTLILSVSYGSTDSSPASGKKCRSTFLEKG